MKRYTLRGLIHDAKVFNQLRLEYRRTNKTQSKDASSGWLLGYLTGMRRRARALAGGKNIWFGHNCSTVVWAKLDQA